MIDLSTLNPCQFAATTHEGNDHCLILAGAGSGKTRVLTYRIAWLVESQHVSPYKILAFTFTNKAANEMKERTERLLGEDMVVKLMTFHRFGLMFLKRYGSRAGLMPGFSIYDTSQSETLVKHLFENGNYKEKLAHPDFWTPKRLFKKIAYYKDTGKTAEDIFSEGNQFENAKNKGDFEVIGELYTKYDAGLRDNNAIDFADMLKLTHQILKSCDDVREAFRQHYQHILVDEFQDTNLFQIEILKLLCGESTRLTAVGDDDQSIYGWRGADNTAILRFEQMFGACTVYKLEQNYRSTAPILACASALIAHNKDRNDKTLWTATPGGDPVRCFKATTMKNEASLVVSKIKALRKQMSADWQDFAILFRVNSRSSLFETACSQLGVPYTIVGGTGFYEREEIADLLSYLRLLVNPLDRMSFSRIVNRPARNIGEKSVEKLFALLEQKEQFGVPRKDCLFSLLEDIAQKRCIVPRGGAKFVEGCTQFLNVLKRVHDWQTTPPRLTLEAILAETQYREYLKKVCLQKAQPYEEALERVDFLLTLLDDHQRETPNDLAGFLEEISIVHPEDNDTSDTVKLMTLHASKGLEFKTVFIVGVAERVFPLPSKDGGDTSEEERRLMYVGMTRAREKLYISYPMLVAGHGNDFFESGPSEFFNEMLPAKREYVVWERDPDPEANQRGAQSHGARTRPGLTWSSSKPAAPKPLVNDEARYYDIPNAAYEEESAQLGGSTTNLSPKRVSPSERPAPPKASSSSSAPTPSSNGATALSKNRKKLHVGSHVIHRVHGMGVIFQITGSGFDAKAVIDFEDGRRTIITRFLDA